MRKQKQKLCFEIIKVGKKKGVFGVLTQFDGDVTLKFVLETNCVDAGDSLNHCRFSVSDMSDCANVDRGLPRYHLR
jgi:hypothetical protein